jgi:hypothetical protein
MYTYIMSHRTQIILSDSQYDRLKWESERSGVRLGELIRRAITATYGDIDPEAARAAWENSFGLWKDRDFDSVEYVDRLRRGMARRLER